MLVECTTKDTKEKVSNIFVEISQSGLEGYLTLICKDTNISFTYDEVFSIIKEKIKFGLNDNVVKDMIDNKIYNERVCIAKGILPVDEKDGYIKYYFDKNKKVIPKLKKDGTVDYKDLKLVNNVDKGDILAEIILPSGGKEGRSVTGENIPYRKGKIPLFKYGKNVKKTDNGLYLVSTDRGQVKLVNDRLVVLNVLEVSSVDNSTGNIVFNGSVKVKENVINGFQLKAEGDIEILGVVEGANIESLGDILIRKGVQGYNTGKISSKGNVVAKFIENSSISCRRDLTAEAIMHSDVVCNGSVNVIGKKGLLVGGTCRARKEIKAKIIGSRMATSTTLEVGVEPETKIKYEKLEKEIFTMKKNLSKIEKSLIVLEKILKSNKSEEKKELYIKLKNIEKTLRINLNRSNKELNLIKKEINNVSRGKIKVEDIIYPGVKIIIGDSVMFIRDEMSNCTFYEDKGEIKIGPY